MASNVAAVAHDSLAENIPGHELSFPRRDFARVLQTVSPL
jgi:hypothetical protein